MAGSTLKRKHRILFYLTSNFSVAQNEEEKLIQMIKYIISYSKKEKTLNAYYTSTAIQTSLHYAWKCYCSRTIPVLLDSWFQQLRKLLVIWMISSQSWLSSPREYSIVVTLLDYKNLCQDVTENACLILKLLKMQPGFMIIKYVKRFSWHWLNKTLKVNVL